MPSPEHEMPLALLTRDPSVLVWLLRDVAGLAFPGYASVELRPTEARIAVSSTFHADAVLVFKDGDGRPVLAVVLEVQRRLHRSKLRAWRLYLAHVERELDVSAALLVYVPSDRVAQQYRRLVADDGVSSILKPFVVSVADVPLITDPDEAARSPGAAVLGILAHAADPSIASAFPALAALLGAVDDQTRPTYHDIVLAGLPASTRARWRDFMTATKLPYLSEEFNAAYAEGEAVGRAEGEAVGRAEGEAVGRAEGLAEALLSVLGARQIEVSDAERKQIVGTRDVARLTAWLDRALTASSVEEVLSS